MSVPSPLAILVTVNITYTALKKKEEIDIDLGGLGPGITLIDGPNIDMSKILPAAIEATKAWCKENTVGFVKINSLTLRMNVYSG